MEVPTTTFKDARGRPWTVRVTGHAIRRVRERLGVEIGKWQNDRFALLRALLDDVPQLLDVLFVLLEDDARTAGVTDEDFGRAFDGDAIEAAADALVGAFVLFSPSQSRTPLLALIRKGKEFATKAAERATRAIERVDLDSLLTEATRTSTSSGSSGSSPASAGSTPAPGPSAN